jgi:hypothetical protein
MPRSAATTTSTDLVYLELTTSEGPFLADALEEAAGENGQATANYLRLVAKRIRSLGTNNASQNGYGH